MSDGLVKIGCRGVNCRKVFNLSVRLSRIGDGFIYIVMAYQPIKISNQLILNRKVIMA